MCVLRSKKVGTERIDSGDRLGGNEISAGLQKDIVFQTEKDYWVLNRSDSKDTQLIKMFKSKDEKVVRLPARKKAQIR